eukprot:5918999-Alexandrium_andersonii.AAC.1
MEKRLKCAYRTANKGWAWAPYWLPVAVGMFFGVTGCPRCPVTVAAAVGAAVHRCGRWWGPPSFLTGANIALQKAAAWLQERAETAIARLEK